MSIFGTDPDIRIETLGGNCPVQAEGTIDGKPFYFRARGQRWHMGIGGEPVMEPEWSYGEPYGDEYEAGWMPTHEALGFIAKAVGLYANRDADATARELVGTLEMVRDADNDAKADGLRTIPEAARARIDAALAMAGRA